MVQRVAQRSRRRVIRRVINVIGYCRGQRREVREGLGKEAMVTTQAQTQGVEGLSRRGVGQAVNGKLSREASVDHNLKKARLRQCLGKDEGCAVL